MNTHNNIQYSNNKKNADVKHFNACISTSNKNNNDSMSFNIIILKSFLLKFRRIIKNNL